MKEWINKFKNADKFDKRRAVALSYIVIASVSYITSNALNRIAAVSPETSPNLMSKATLAVALFSLLRSVHHLRKNYLGK